MLLIVTFICFSQKTHNITTVEKFTKQFKQCIHFPTQTWIHHKIELFEEEIQQVPTVSGAIQSALSSINSTPIINQETTNNVYATTNMIEEPFSQNTESFANEQVCPAVKKLRRLGSIQIAIGYSLAALSAVFGILDAVQTNRATKCITYNDLCYDYSLVFDVACLFNRDAYVYMYITELSAERLQICAILNSL